MQENDWQGQGSLAGKTPYEDLREWGSWQRKYMHRPWGGNELCQFKKQKGSGWGIGRYC